jgi:hypothetical protein
MKSLALQMLPDEGKYGPMDLKWLSSKLTVNMVNLLGCSLLYHSNFLLQHRIFCLPSVLDITHGAEKASVYDSG